MTQPIHKTECEKCGASTMQVMPVDTSRTMPLSALALKLPKRSIYCVGCGALLYGGVS